ncbi:ABC transporter ATP-binding protein [Uliginosibacterium sp. H1]|uniref:ABC transporter ATP-binding protein n=1 Tax=Uliginosibacterium sp. H1 TaxID=3114757 RepID=UPI002E182303|nr:ABC transporter ATP-binding protein [Uliginosibacterium sp. H1]
MNVGTPSAFLSPAPAGSALQAQGLRFGYGKQGAIFDAVSLQVRPREIVALLGGSGCGKSTLLRVLAGLEQPAAGEVRFLGEPLRSPHPRAALVFQQASLLPWLDVRGNVRFGLDFAHQPKAGRKALDARVAQAIEAVGLAGREHAFPAQLSGGMAQRVALARALAREPALLFADEPFSALDAITRAEMQNLLVELVHRWHAATLLVTHDIDEAVLVADRILLMGRGAQDQPAGIVREWTVDIPRPRDAHPAATTALRLDILAALRSLRHAPDDIALPASAS